ncbi:hypothetical protein BDV95DRAFT_612230 [Massariosphaeria phaeospora]|uniref:Uncharacterized protein n=1 Tax=Massariosphaeria phaeospora TaxID=100035 RepID=A0A7C8M304_9PLEO|nr:hypothetical protein BDV95DRAFT_612230 [Massariosphaeria phaeospora]
MLALNNPPPVNMMKRQRGDDSELDEGRHLKKSRSWVVPPLNSTHGSFPSPSKLPLRPTLTPSPPRIVPHLDTMTPAQSEHADSPPSSIVNEPFVFSSPRRDMDVDMDMDMDEDEDDFDIVGSQPPDSPFVSSNFLRPATLNSELFVPNSPLHSTGRIPTPIYPNFQPGGMHHTGGTNGLGYPSCGLAGAMSRNHGPTWPPIMQAPPPSRKHCKQMSVDQNRNNMRMPSPISEDEDLPDTPTALTQSQLSRLSVTSHTPSDHMDVGFGCADETPASPLNVPPTPTGRKRSGAFTGKGRFSMGYRDDCDKCRQRVPGHYSHFLP